MEEPLGARNDDDDDDIKSEPKTNKIQDHDGVDGCYAWFATFLGFMIYIVSGGVAYTGGIILPELLASFPDTDEALGALLVSLVISIMYVGALCASFLCEVYGWRKVVLAGSVMSSLGLFISAFVPSFSALYFTYGTLLGLGLGIQYPPCLFIVQRHFTRRHAMATSIVCSGSSIGVFLFAVLLRQLIDYYAWRGALLVISGITLNTFAFGLLLAPPVKSAKNPREIQLTPESMDEKHNCSNWLDHLKLFCKSLLEVFFSLLQTIKDLVDPKYSLFLLAQFLKSLEKNVPYVLLPMKLLHLGYSEWQVAILVAVMGVGDFIGRLLVGIQSTICGFNRTLFFAASLLLSGATEVITGLISDYYGLCTCAFFTAVCGGVVISSDAPLLADLVGVEKAPRSYGLICLGQGAGGLIGLPIAAVIHEGTNNINIPFFVCGSFPVMAFVVMIVVYVLQRRSRVT